MNRIFDCRFLILPCMHFNCSFSLPTKDPSAEYPSENFPCTLHCSRDHIFLYELLPCNLHGWRGEKRLHDRCEYVSGFPVIACGSVVTSVFV